MLEFWSLRRSITAKLPEPAENLPELPELRRNSAKIWREWVIFPYNRRFVFGRAQYCLCGFEEPVIEAWPLS
jgi:hypothetical protein